MRLLLMLMLVDYVTGIIAAMIRRELSAAESWKGLLRKSLVIAVLGTSHLMEENLGMEIGIEKIGAVAYCVNEAISIVENVARSGVPIPGQLVAALLTMKKLRMREATQSELDELRGKQDSELIALRLKQDDQTHALRSRQDNAVDSQRS